MIRTDDPTLENLDIRLKYYGNNSEERLINDKARSLNKSLLYAYQSQTIILKDGSEFRCLINENSTKPEYNDKILSIPYKDIQLNAKRIGTTTEGKIQIPIKAGDVFTWKDTNTKWIVYLQFINEKAYFKAEIRKCEAIIELVDLKNKPKYDVYIRGPIETNINWKTSGKNTYNSLNYSAMIYITKDEITSEYIKRFARVKINGKPYEVQTQQDFIGDGIIQAYLSEDYTDEFEDIQESIQEEELPEEIIQIKGNKIVYPYDTVEYTIIGLDGGTWEISNKKAKILKQTGEKVNIEVVTGRSGEFNLIYKKNNNILKTMNIKINSLS